MLAPMSDRFHPLSIELLTNWIADELEAIVHAQAGRRQNPGPPTVDPIDCEGCGVCVRSCNKKHSLSLAERDKRVLTPLNGTHRAVVMAIERGKGELYEQVADWSKLLDGLLDDYRDIRKTIKQAGLNQLDTAADIQTAADKGADTGNAVAESDETDNRCSERITVELEVVEGSIRWLIPVAASSPGASCVAS